MHKLLVGGLCVTSEPFCLGVVALLVLTLGKQWTLECAGLVGGGGPGECPDGSSGDQRTEEARSSSKPRSTG